MSIKRKSGFDDHGANKRNRPSGFGDAVDLQSGGYSIQSRVDPVTGQRGAFPGLDDGGAEDNMFYGPAEDGLEYLRMVRAEAQTVPSVLLAASHIQNRHGQSGDDRSNGNGISSARFWLDEAIIAGPAPDYEDWDNDESDDEKDPQDAYYSALIDRFRAVRARFSVESPSAEISASPQMRSATARDAVYKQWYHGMTNTSPTPQHVAGLSQREVMIGLERLGMLLTKRNLERSSWRTNLGAWSWALLAKCRDRSELDGDDTGTVRALARSAQRLERKLRAIAAGVVQNADIEDPPGQTGDGVEAGGPPEIDAVGVTGGPEELEAARAKLLGIMDSEQPKFCDPDSSENDADLWEPALMLLDSIVTVVGEMYGQRDLLEQRVAW